MKGISQATSALAAAALVSGVMLMGASGAVAAEPLRLSHAEMDSVTAGAIVRSKVDAISKARGKRANVKTLTSTKASPKSTSGSGQATATAKEGKVKTDLVSVSEVPGGKVEAKAGGSASGDAASDSKVNTSATKGGAATVVKGIAINKTTGDGAKRTAEVTPTVSGDKTHVNTITNSNNKAGIIVAVGVGVGVDIPTVKIPKTSKK